MYLFTSNSNDGLKMKQSNAGLYKIDWIFFLSTRATITIKMTIAGLVFANQISRFKLMRQQLKYSCLFPIPADTGIQSVAKSIMKST